jgi:DNA-dependent protein kinase catalytic subunit
MKLRNNFIKNYAVMSVGCYLLGVGDRHMDNFLFDKNNGDIISIDFGYSFGIGLGLGVPELVPMRLT